MAKLTTFQPAVFLLTFMSYALYHMVRKTPSYVQTSLINEWTPLDFPQRDASPHRLNIIRDDDADSSTSNDTGGSIQSGGYPAPATAPERRPSLFPDKQSAEAFIGVLNAVFLFVYAGGNLLSGMLAERFDHRLMLTAGMTLSALVMFVFGPVLEWTGARSKAAYVVLEVSVVTFVCCS